MALPGQVVLSKLENVLGQFPFLKGEGDAKRRVRGEEKNLCTPHPALRATLSLQERDLPQNIFQFGQHNLASGDRAEC
jgi:hypothetical protein